MIVAGGMGIGRPSATPRVRGAGKGRINEGSSLPGVKIDGLARSPLNLLPVAPATDLGGGGKIAGDPIFDVKEIGVALDQLAREILRQLKDHKVTVVWLFDESISHAGRPEDHPREVRPRLQRAEAVHRQDQNKKAAGALNHAIVGFGQGIDYVLEKPRDNIDQIGRAIKKLRIDSTGIENTMTGDPRGRRAIRQHGPQGPQGPDRPGDRRVGRRRRRRRGGAPGAQAADTSRSTSSAASRSSATRMPTTASRTRSPTTSTTR